MKAVVVYQVAVQRGAEGRVQAVRVQTTRGLEGADTVMKGIGGRAAAAALTALMKVIPEKGRNESVRKPLSMKENMHVVQAGSAENLGRLLHSPFCNQYLESYYEKLPLYLKYVVESSGVR